MDDTQVADPAVPAPTPVAAPPAPPEQAPTAATEPTSADASLQRAYTQTSQKLAAVAAALNIPKTSTAEQFVAAINARRQTLAAADSELESNPELARRAAELQAREEKLVRAQYGESADLALTLRDAAAQGIGLVDLVQLVEEHLADRVASRASAAPAPAGGPAAAPQASPPQQAAPAPERTLMADVPRGNERMFTPPVTPEPGEGPESFMRRLIGAVPALGR